MKTQNKIVYVLLIVFFSYTLLFSGFIYYSISNYAFTDFYKRLEIRAITTAKSQLENEGEGNIIRELRQEYLEVLPDEEIKMYKLPESGDWRGIRELGEFKDGFIDEILEDGTSMYNDSRTFFYGTTYTTVGKATYLVIISAENYFITHHVHYLRNLLFTSLAIAFVIILVVAFLFTRKYIQPINDIIEKVKEISSENLHLRLNQQSKNDDTISQLSQTFNDMLNRLETSFETQKNFISNASHELNTPLTSIIGEADVTLSKVRRPEEYIMALQTILEEAEKLDKKTKALLMLAQTGFDGKRQKFQMLRTDQLIMDVKDTVEKIYPGSKISIDFSLLPENPYRLKINANEALLHLALSNIILNGCKYSDFNPVHVALGVSDGKVIIIVKDEGIGIPDSEMKYIYDPYFRASNTKNHEGYGIGLPLARNIVRMHRGELVVNSTENEGTTVQITLPCFFTNQEIKEGKAEQIVKAYREGRTTQVSSNL
ncbi:sensor histidine kinase [Echinicola vietnamensis]|uniref:histidine kinase n=1 Tax=Echinicola vietnamensis (strain DSM 17526 / LMG 23754 / KMM 6221) TaxID=926556 RepID=L0G1X7_ECHVK|nr:HAMP domain-containing sensor histidine kinase [Echinicola vietnamensis]AGA78865.1 signal transduction histidine kinase [Echinicola vietnamensis DSM 17526]